jgi:hypothetical protein
MCLCCLMGLFDFSGYFFITLWFHQQHIRQHYANVNREKNQSNPRCKENSSHSFRKHGPNRIYSTPKTTTASQSLKNTTKSQAAAVPSPFYPKSLKEDTATTPTCRTHPNQPQTNNIAGLPLEHHTLSMPQEEPKTLPANLNQHP